MENFVVHNPTTVSVRVLYRNLKNFVSPPLAYIYDCIVMYTSIVFRGEKY